MCNGPAEGMSWHGGPTRGWRGRFWGDHGGLMVHAEVCNGESLQGLKQLRPCTNEPSLIVNIGE